MITSEELKIANESYTNKDFASIYPEIVSLVKKLSTWDPSLSNESDPGNVLLKAMAFLADKINYNTDKGTLENFLPSATQETSARNLFEMSGYFPKYYQSAITGVKFRYTGSKLTAGSKLTFPAMKTVISDIDGNVMFSLMEPLEISESSPVSNTVPAIQGTFKTLAVGDGNTIKLSDLDDNNRIYLPEPMIAQNGVFIFDADGFDESTASTSGSTWTMVDNLNLVRPDVEKRGYFRFGFDSNKGLPFIEFPDNIADLIGSGLIVKYVITAGKSGNVSAQYLTKLVEQGLTSDTFDFIGSDDSESSDADDLTIYNVSATINGADPEGIDEAYNSFKKTVGTFDTLVTCRDYANAIYSMLDETTSYPYVSNAQVSDRRSDINYGNSIVTYSSLGKEVVMDTDDEEITPFTLCLYPLNPIRNIYDVSSYIESFKPLKGDSLKYLKEELEGLKTLSHTYQTLDDDDIYMVKNYYKLNIRLTTSYKVNAAEQLDIQNNVRKALYESFNARKVDYGYEIPFDTIYGVIKGADARIKNVSMDDPDVDTRILLASGEEVSISKITSGTGDTAIRGHYLSILAKNILAGRMPLFDYDTEFSYDFGQSAVQSGTAQITSDKIHEIKSVTTELNLPVASHMTGTEFEYDIGDNEIIQLIAPSLSSPLTYPAYVNFRYEGSSSIPANTEHRISGNEVLRINYTDSDKKVMNVTYTPTSIIRNGKVEVKDAVYIRANFEVQPTADSYSAGGRSVIDKTVGGVTMKFNTLAADEQIEERETVCRVIDDTELYCYWSVDRADNKLFTSDDAVHETSDPSSNIKYYERLLGDNEYLAYCDAALTDVVIRGSGTLLRWMSTRPLPAADTTWSCQKQGIDGLVDNGISAFADFSWKTMSFRNENLEIHVMQILTLGAGDSIKIGDCDLTGNLTNDWAEVSNSSKIEYAIAGGEWETLDSYDIPYMSWDIRTRLDIASGPAVGQQIRENHKLIFEDAEGTEYTVEPYGNPLVEPFMSLSQYVSTSGGKNIDLTVTELTAEGVSEPKCTLSAFVYNYTQPSYDIVVSGNDVSKNLEKTNGYYIIPCEKLKYVNDVATVSLPMLSDSNSDDTLLIMFHVNEGEGLEYTITVGAGADSVRLYNSGDSFSSDVTLTSASTDEAIRIVEVAQSHSNDLTITVTYTGSSADKAVCNLAMSGISVAKAHASPSDPSQMLHLSERFGLSESEESTLLADIRELDSHGLFFYNAPINNGSAVDIDDPSKPEFFWDRNNLFNKFTLGEIDFSDGGTAISIVKSSQV